MKKVLRALSTLVVMAGSATVGGVVAGTTFSKNTKELEERYAKILALYMAFNQWLCIRQEGKTLVEYFEKNGYMTVAIYGMKELGERLYDELNGSDITVKYAIDKNANSIFTNVNVVTPDGALEEVDAIVVTAITFFDEIEYMLSEKVDCPIISLEDILYDM